MGLPIIQYEIYNTTQFNIIIGAVTLLILQGHKSNKHKKLYILIM